MASFFKIYEHDHFHHVWEDMKHGLYILYLNDEIKEWIKENLSNSYDINCDDYYNDNRNGVDYIFIEFKEEVDAMAFKLRWM